jgi:hypothetical protein
MRVVLWILMWSTIGALIGMPVVILIEHFAGNPPELVRPWLGALTVWAGLGAGVLVNARWDWPRWLE